MEAVRDQKAVFKRENDYKKSLIVRNYGNQGKFLKAVQECMNYEKSDNDDIGEY